MITNYDPLLQKDTVLQPSSIRHYHFPDEREWNAPQSSRSATRYDRRAVEVAATANTPDLKAFEKNTRSKSLPEKILFLISHEAFNFSPRGDIVNCHDLQSKIAAAVNASRPISIAYPLMCKIGLPAKQWFNLGPTAGEEATLHFFKHLNSTVQKIYEPGIRLLIASDARLYDDAFLNEVGAVEKYVGEVQGMIRDAGLCDIVEMHDYADLLAATDYRAALGRYQDRLAGGDPAILAGIDEQTLRESVRASINLRPLGLTYGDYKALYSIQRDPTNPHWDVVEAMAATAFNTILPIRLACSEVNALAKIWPDAIRASCHKGKKNGSWPLGLRVFPEYLKSSKLLPYHGVPLITVKSRDASGHARLQMEIHPEIFLMGHPELTRVTWGPRGETYFYDGRDLDHKLNLTISQS